jgi:molybdopterin converting factor small subunit
LKSTTGFVASVALPPALGGGEIIIDNRPDGIEALRNEIRRKVPTSAEVLDDTNMAFAINGEMLIASERDVEIRDGDRITIVPAMSGG